MKRKLGLLFFAVLFLTNFLFAEDVPAPSGWVNDFANVISADYQNKLNAAISALEEKTSAEIAVVTINSIAPYDEKQYARLLFDNWKPGKKGKDNGVLILLAIKERAWRIETGYGVEEVLPDGLCGQIGRNYMVPYFKSGNYEEGLYNGVSAIVRVLSGDNSVADENNGAGMRTNFPSGPLPYAGVALFSLFFFSLWNIPWPIFIGLPFTIMFTYALGQSSVLMWLFPLIGYIVAMVIRYFIWRDSPLEKRKSFLWVLIFGLAALSRHNSNRYYGGSSGWGGGGFGGGGFGGGGFGGGGGGGGGAGGHF